METTQTPFAAVILGASLLSAASAAQAALIDRGGGLIYDNVLNITWLQNANYAKTSGYDADGLMSWSEATTWAANLSYYDSVRNVTYTDWRLPTVSPINHSTFDYSASYNGSTDYGYNISAQGTAYAGSTDSELAHLFYNSLDNKGYCTPSSVYPSCTVQAGWGLVNKGPFTHLQSSYLYWSGTEYARLTDNAWGFNFGGGDQLASGMSNVQYALAVRPGDVPVPTAAWLFGSGLFGLAGIARKRSRY